MEHENAWTLYTEDDLNELEQINASYKKCLDEGKTERECVKLAVRMAEEHGYKNFENIKSDNQKVNAGDKIYATYMDKSIVLFQMGTESMEKGMNNLGAHINSPRIDVKQNPLYETEEITTIDDF